MNAIPSNNDRALIGAIIEALSQGETLLTEISDEMYTRKVSVAFDASIGGHYRHCLDHFRGVLQSVHQDSVNYDLRQRGTQIETDRLTALNATHQLRQEFEALDPLCLSRTLAVTCKTSFTADTSQSAGSTVGREMMYSVAHAVHHYALIGVMGGIMGCRLPAGFGVAPSTLKYRADSSQAASSAG